MSSQRRRRTVDPPRREEDVFSLMPGEEDDDYLDDLLNVSGVEDIPVDTETQASESDIDIADDSYQGDDGVDDDELDALLAVHGGPDAERSPNKPGGSSDRPREEDGDSSPSPEVDDVDLFVALGGWKSSLTLTSALEKHVSTLRAALASEQKILEDLVHLQSQVQDQISQLDGAIWARTIMATPAGFKPSGKGKGKA